MKQAISKWRPLISVVVAVLTIGLPLVMMIDGYVLMMQNDPLHPDALVLMAYLVWGLVGLVGVIAYGIHCYRVGWHGLTVLQRWLFSIYGVIFVLGLLMWLPTLGVSSFDWSEWIIYGQWN